MQRPGRNDPCYCGSGKKYKQCHMPADLAAENQARALQDAARFLRADLLEFADEERFDPELDKALPLYWNDYYNADNDELMSPSESERFFDWFIFDYSPEGEKRVVERYQDERGPKLNPAQRDMLAAWTAAGPMSAYEFTGYEGQTLRVKEFMTGAEADVYAPMGHGQMPTGSLILTRLLPVAERLEFGVLPAYIPADEIGDLKSKLEAARAEDSQGTEAEFMRRHNILLIYHALEQAKLAGRPPVARLDPRHAGSGVPRRQRHEHQRVKGPSGNPAETMPHQTFTRRKAIG